jgi:hypothetical protein
MPPEAEDLLITITAKQKSADPRLGEPSSVSERASRPASDAQPTAQAGEALPRLRLGRGEQLLVESEGKRTAVHPVRCFPWSAPDELVSLRDSDQNEVWLVDRIGALDSTSAHALARALGSAGFVLEIARVEAIEEDYELRVWRVETRQGRRTFQTPLDEWPWSSPDGGYFVRDLSGDLFRIPRPDTLDEQTRNLLWAYVG